MVKQRKEKEMVTGNRREEGGGEWRGEEKEICRSSWKEGGKRSS